LYLEEEEEKEANMEMEVRESDCYTYVADVF